MEGEREGTLSDVGRLWVCGLFATESFLVFGFSMRFVIFGFFGFLVFRVLGFLVFWLFGVFEFVFGFLWGF